MKKLISNGAWASRPRFGSFRGRDAHAPLGNSQSCPHHHNLWINVLILLTMVCSLSASAQTYHYTVSDASGAPLVRFLDDGTVQMLRGVMVQNATVLQLTPNESVPEFIIRNGADVVARIDGVSGNFYLKGGSSTAHPLQENPGAREFIIRDDLGKVVFKIDEGGNAIRHENTDYPVETPYKVTIKLSGKGGAGPYIGEQFFADGATITVTATEGDYEHYFMGFTVIPPYNGAKIFLYPSQSFTVTQDMTITANFRAIDLPGNLAKWALHIYGTTAYNEASFDTNGLFYASENVYGPWMNGIPDLAEFALLQGILMDINHPAHAQTRAKWLQARATVFADVLNGVPPGSECEKKLKLDAKILGAMAAYRCLGFESNVASKLHFANSRNFYSSVCTPYFIPLQTIWPTPIPPLLQTLLAPNGDLDGDGFTNYEEWRWSMAMAGSFNTGVTTYTGLASDITNRPIQKVDPANPGTDTDFNAITIFVKGNGDIFPHDGTMNFHTYAQDCATPHACGYTLIPISAIPRPGWVFRRWHGLVDAFDNPHLDLSMERSYILTAEFIPDDGNDNLDLLGDLEFVLGLLPGQTSIETFDCNGISYLKANNYLASFTGNGIPDYAEMALLQEVLKNRTLDLSKRGGIVHDPVQSAWAANLVGLAAQLPALNPRLANVLAAYLCLGDFDSAKAAQSILAGAAPGSSLNIDATTFDRSRLKFFDKDRSPSQNGITNLDAWNSATGSDFNDRVANFAFNSLGGIGK